MGEPWVPSRELPLAAGLLGLLEAAAHLAVRGLGRQPALLLLHLEQRAPLLCAELGHRLLGAPRVPWAPTRSSFFIALASSGFERSIAAVDAFWSQRRSSGTFDMSVKTGRR